MLWVVVRAFAIGSAGFNYGQGVVMMFPDWSPQTWFISGTLCLSILFIEPVWKYRKAIGSWISGERKLSDVSLDVPAWLVYMVIGAVVAVAAGWNILTHVPTKWVHQTISLKEQEIVKAECEMKALEAHGDWVATMTARDKYYEACLVSRGFEQIEVAD